MGPVIVSPRRALYDFIVADSKAMNLPNVVPTPGFLRSDVLLTAGQAALFNIAQDQNQAGQTIGGAEQRLSNNDAFYVTDISVQLYTCAAPGAATQATNPNRVRAPLQPFPNATVFGLNGPEAIALFNGGKFTLKQNDRIYIRDMDVYSMQFADQAQQGLTATTPTNTTEGTRGWRNVQDPMIRLNGPSNIEATLRFPDNLEFDKVTNASVYAALIFRGWLAQNGGVARAIGA